MTEAVRSVIGLQQVVESRDVVLWKHYPAIVPYPSARSQHPTAAQSMCSRPSAHHLGHRGKAPPTNTATGENTSEPSPLFVIFEMAAQLHPLTRA
ncbi:hypothetical protein JTE90_015086 [Oedothorax gibbosus]|uniref:Uncharacterized protein n=1 Tax=Oedothorax gibbosus TaxID=931172 RepID=A0AAV6VST1_9ARAC|nr:hypothetical protein JTE90_015086 [Oedothorax gibbosus]